MNAFLLTGFLLLAAPGVDVSALKLGPEVTRVQHGARVFIALDQGGVAVVDATNPDAPRLVARLAEGRHFTRLLVDGEVLLAIETRNEASAWSLENPESPSAVALSSLPVPRAEPPAPTATQTTPPAPAAAPPARVVAVQGGRVIFDAGASRGFGAGARVRVISQRMEYRPDLVTGETVRVPSGETTAVVRIEQAEAERSMAKLGRGDVVEPNDEAVLTDLPLTQSLFVPRRAPFTTLFGFHARPFLGLSGGSKPVGFLVDAYGSYYLENFPLVVGVAVAPIGVAIGAKEAHYPGTFVATAAYAQDYFEIGFGAGALIGNIGPCTQQMDPLGGAGPEVCEVNTGFTLNQSLRLGAVDGLNVSWRSSIFSRPDQWVFGVGRGEVNVPVTSQLGLFGAGGGGESGWAFGELGVRTYVGGTGARGTLIVSGSLGYSAIFDGPSHEMVGGPSVAFGLEWRR